MAQQYSSEEVEARYIDAMGARLGKQYYQLFNECAYLHLKWHEYMALFGTSPAEIDLLNQAAPRFFGLLEVVLWEDVLAG
jgi:hypothetical protein